MLTPDEKQRVRDAALRRLSGGDGSGGLPPPSAAALPPPSALPAFGVPPPPATAAAATAAGAGLRPHPPTHPVVSPAQQAQQQQLAAAALAAQSAAYQQLQHQRYQQQHPHPTHQHDQRGRGRGGKRPRGHILGSGDDASEEEDEDDGSGSPSPSPTGTGAAAAAAAAALAQAQARMRSRQNAAAQNPNMAAGDDLHGGDEADPDKATAAVFAPYTCRSRAVLAIPDTRPHPGDISESSGLAAVALPPTDFPIRDSIPAQVISDGKLSRLQLEAVLYACAAHQTRLADGRRAGFFCGDGAGVGKGRTIAATILDSMARGRPTHLWLSTSGDLRRDAERDFAELGFPGVPVVGGTADLDHALANGYSSQLNKGVLFATYSTLVSPGRQGLSRIDQIVDWLVSNGGPSVARERGRGRAEQVDAAMLERLMRVAMTDATESSGKDKGGKGKGGNGKGGKGRRGTSTADGYYRASVGGADADSAEEAEDDGDEDEEEAARRPPPPLPSDPDELRRLAAEAAFDGVIVLDESHKAKHFVAGNAEASSKVARRAIQLQRRLPNARVVYCSATGLTEIDNAAYLTRLSLYGPGTPFLTFDRFVHALKARGTSFLELLALTLKSQGTYVARQLSFAAAEFQEVSAPMTPRERAMYDGAAAAWHAVRQGLDACLTLTGRDNLKTRGQFHKQYWAAHQRFFRSMCVSLKLPSAVREARAALAAGHCVVIGLQSTGEAAAADLQLTHGTELPCLISSCKAGLRFFVERHVPTSAAQLEVQRGSSEDEDGEEDEDDDGNAGGGGGVGRGGGRRGAAGGRGRGRGAAAGAAGGRRGGAAGGPSSDEADEDDDDDDDGDGNGGGGGGSGPSFVPGQDIPQAVGIKKRLLTTIDALQLPPTPLDELIDRLGGPSQVAEMTGRRGRIVRKPSAAAAQGATTAAPRPRYVYELRDRSTSHAAVSGIDALESVNLVEQRHFSEGRKLVALISDASSTGISLHASRTFRNSRRRVHLSLELPFSADKTVQQLGRTMRSNQMSAPIYKVLFSAVGGEKRFAAAVARRMQSLGALTRGDRRAGVARDALGSGSLHYDSPWGRQALRRMFTHVSARLPDLPSGVTLSAVFRDADASTRAGVLHLLEAEEEEDRQQRARQQGARGSSAGGSGSGGGGASGGAAAAAVPSAAAVPVKPERVAAEGGSAVVKPELGGAATAIEEDEDEDEDADVLPPSASAAVVKRDRGGGGAAAASVKPDPGRASVSLKPDPGAPSGGGAGAGSSGGGGGGQLDADADAIAAAAAAARASPSELRRQRREVVTQLHGNFCDYLDMMALEYTPGPGRGARGAGGAAAVIGAPGKGPTQGMTKKARDVGDVRRFLNRLLGLPVGVQSLLFNYFNATLQAEIAAAKREGRFTEGLADLTGSSISRACPPRVLWDDEMLRAATAAAAPGARRPAVTLPAALPAGKAAVERFLPTVDDADAGGGCSGDRATRTVLHLLSIDRGVHFAEARARLERERVPGDLSGFRRSHRAMFGSFAVLLALQKPGTGVGGRQPMFTLIRPATGESGFEMPLQELRDKYGRVPDDDPRAMAMFEQEWEEAWRRSSGQCLHGAGCSMARAVGGCTVGRRVMDVVVLTGAVVRAWRELASVIGMHQEDLPRSDRALRVVRVQLGKRSGEEEEEGGAAGAAAAVKEPAAVKKEAAAAAAEDEDMPPAAPEAEEEEEEVLVGVRYPLDLLPEVYADLRLSASRRLGQLQQQQQAQAGGAAAAAAGGAAATATTAFPSAAPLALTEPPAPVVRDALKRYGRGKNTMDNYFPRASQHTPTAMTTDAGGTAGGGGTAGEEEDEDAGARGNGARPPLAPVRAPAASAAAAPKPPAVGKQKKDKPQQSGPLDAFFRAPNGGGGGAGGGGGGGRAGSVVELLSDSD
jgi:hypothetical protein